MKKIINILSILGIIAAPCWITYLYLKEAPVLEATASTTEDAFKKDFPLNQSRFVDFKADEGSLERLTERERMDQLRDWLLLTVVSNTSLSVDELNQSLYDLPTVRYGYMKPVSNFEYGETRSLYIGKDRVVVLLPEGRSPKERMDDLAHIADKHRKDTGKIPSEIEVFDYNIKLDKQFALLTRREKVNAQTLFSEGEYGYHEAEIKSLDDLQLFMNQVEDVTFAQIKGSSLILRGRKILSRDYRGIRVEDVAAIWQSEKKIQTQIAEFEARWDAKSQDVPPYDYEKAKQEAIAEWQRLKLVNGSGFSLDPSYDYDSLKNTLAKAKPALLGLTVDGLSVVSQQDIDAIELGLSKKDVVPYLSLVDKLKKNVKNPRLGEAGTAQDVNDFLRSLDTHSFQAARYDGELQGTEVGMVLFYTDLLAKLWALNYLSTTPQKDIPDFKPLTKVSISSIYKQEAEELRSTRLWFGHQDKGFQVADGGKTIIFARNATRVYAASSNPLKPGDETTPSAMSEAFLGWWNDHYEEIARYEPQYERLNQIMKWSLIISWLNKAEQGETLGFLQNVQVKRDNWFPDWVQINSKDLKFKRWDQVRFYARSNKGSKTESMPLLSSDTYNFFGKARYFKGGVSLANKQLFQGRASLPATSNVGELGRRSNLKYDAVSAIDDGLNLNTLEGTTYTLKNLQPDLSSVTAKAKDGVKFRGRDSELANIEFTRNIARTDAGVEIRTFVGETELGTFSTAKHQNGFSVGWVGREIDEGQSLAMRLSQTSNNIEQVLIETSDLESIVKLNDNAPTYFVKKPYWSRWLKLAKDEAGNANIPPGWKSRVGGFENDDQTILLAWVDDEAVNRLLEQGIAQHVPYNPPSAGGSGGNGGGNGNDKIIVFDDPNNGDDGGFAANLRNNKYEIVAQRMVKKPYDFLKFTKNYFKAKLKQINKFIETKNYTKAARDIDDLIQLYGSNPDLMIRKAVVDIGQGLLNIKRITSRQFGSDLSQSKANFLDEVIGLLRRSNGNVRFFKRNTKHGFFYVQNTPGLNNIDWNQPIEQSLPLISAKDRVYQLQPGEIGKVKLSRIGYGDTRPFTQPSKPISEPTTSVRPFNILPIGRDSDNECKQGEQLEDDRMREKCCKQGMKEYCDLQSQEEKPIYIVIRPDNT